ncbi:hypothetical protein WG8_5195 [Paenibacillus sp. Aloe-11]|nr:hypothetical protein WG8_5195 [Paenibacillus sp. Aloe-11]
MTRFLLSSVIFFTIKVQESFALLKRGMMQQGIEVCHQGLHKLIGYRVALIISKF